MKGILSALILSLITATSVQAADTFRFMYSAVDNKNGTHSDRYAVKWDHDLISNYTADGRLSLARNDSTHNLVSAFEIGLSKRFPIDRINTVYFRPEIGVVTPSGSDNNYYTGFEVGYITKPFPNEKIRLKVDHAWIEGINNDRQDGTLSRFQATYDINSSLTIGPRAEFRRGNVETDAVTLVIVQKF